MSGHSYGNSCYRCGGEINAYSDYKPFDQVSGECLDCGFMYFTEVTQMSLEEVNELRRDQDLPELTELVKVDERVAI